MLDPLLPIALLLLLSLTRHVEADDVSTILARGGLVDHIIVEDHPAEQRSEENSENDPLRKRRAQRSLVCKWRRYPRVYFYGNLITIDQQVDSPQACASRCRLYNSNGVTCQSANHLDSSKTCELLADQLNVNNRAALQNDAEEVADANLVIPLDCPTVDDVTTPEPSEEDGHENEENEARPKGACGQTFVEPYFPQGALRQRSQTRIVRGTEVNPHSLPWTLSLHRTNDGPLQHFCGATLIRVTDAEESDIAVSAGHCFYREPPENLHVIAGLHNLKENEEGVQIVKGQKWAIYEKYNDQLTIYDVSVIKLEQPIKFSQTVQPACLPDPGELVEVGMLGIVAGWGSQYYGGFANDKLMQIVVPVVNMSTCIYNYQHADNPADNSDIFPDIMFCAGYFDSSMDTCQGDSGGSLVFKSERGFVLRGIVSFGPNGCALAKLPGIYTRVSTFVDWIYEKARNMSSLVKKTEVPVHE